MAILALNQLYELPKSGRYSFAENQNDLLPVLYGDLTENSGNHGITSCPLIDTTQHVYCIAGHRVLSTADGNIFRFFDRNGDEITSGFSVVADGDYEGHGTIAYVIFDTDVGQITCQCQGKTDIDGNLITNPITLIEDLIGETGDVNQTAFALASLNASDTGYTAAGAIVSENTYQFWLNSLASSFLADWYIDGQGKLVIRLNTESTQGLAPTAFFSQHESDRVTGSQYVKNLVNEVYANYAISYAQSDRRYKEGIRSNYLQSDEGSAYIDTQSQLRYGIRRREINFDWTRNTATVNAIQERMITLFKDPLWLIHWEDITFRQIQAEKGDTIVYSWAERKDEHGDPLRNQYAQVLEKEMDLDQGGIRFTLKDLGVPYADDFDIWNGVDASAGDGGYFGSTRSTKVF